MDPAAVVKRVRSSVLFCPDRYIAGPGKCAPFHDSQCQLAGAHDCDRDGSSYGCDTDLSNRRARHEFPEVGNS
jgi:hypothetical protein